MAPLKMEEEMRKRLEDRRIEPSSEAWQKLSSRLEQSKPGNSNKKFWWFGLAAASVGILLMLTIFNDENSTMNEPNVVETELEKIDVPIESSGDLTESESDVLIKDEERASDKVTEQIAGSDIEVDKRSNEKIIKGKQLETKQDDMIVAEVTVDVANKSDFQPADFKDQITVEEDEKAAYEVVEESPSGILSQGVSDDEINALLRNARERLIKKTTTKETSRSVNANALLLEIEDDIDQSFRERVFRTLISGYESVRTVVAERNN